MQQKQQAKHLIYELKEVSMCMWGCVCVWWGGTLSNHLEVVAPYL